MPGRQTNWFKKAPLIAQSLRGLLTDDPPRDPTSIAASELCGKRDDDAYEAARQLWRSIGPDAADPEDIKYTNFDAMVGAFGSYWEKCGKKKSAKVLLEMCAAALKNGNGRDGNDAAAAAAAFPSNVLSHGHVGMVPSQHPMGVAMSYAQQQAILAAQLQQQRQMLNGSTPEYAGSGMAGADGMAQYASASADGAGGGGGGAQDPVHQPDALSYEQQQAHLATQLQLQRQMLADADGGGGGGGGVQDAAHQPDAHGSGMKGPDKPISGGENADDDDDDGHDEGRGQGGGVMVVAAEGKGKGAARGGDGGINDITVGVDGVAIGGGGNAMYHAAATAQPLVFSGLTSAPNGGVNVTMMPQGIFQWGAMHQKAQTADQLLHQKGQEMKLRAQENENNAAAFRVIEAAQKQAEDARNAQAAAEKSAAEEKGRRIAAEQEKEDAMKKVADAEEKKKDAAANQNQLDKIEKGMEEGFTELKRGLKGMNETLNTPIPARAGFAHDRGWSLEDLAGDNVPPSPLRRPSFGHHENVSGGGHPDAHDYDTAFGVGNDQYDTGFGTGISDGKQPSTDDNFGLDGDMTNLFGAVDESESKIGPTIQGPDIDKEEAEEKKDDGSGDEEGELSVKETTKIAPVQRGLGKDFSMMLQNREDKQRAEEEREEEEERKRKEDARQRKITRNVQAEANLASKKTVIPTTAVVPLNKRLLAIQEYDENKVQEELLARESEAAEEEAQKSKKKKSKAKSKQKKGKGKKKDLGPRPDPPLVEITERFDEDSKKNKSRWHRNGRKFAGKILEVTSVKSAAHCTRKLRSNNSSTGWIIFCEYDGGGNDRVVLYDPAHFELVNVAVESEE